MTCRPPARIWTWISAWICLYLGCIWRSSPSRSRRSSATRAWIFFRHLPWTSAESPPRSLLLNVAARWSLSNRALRFHRRRRHGTMRCVLFFIFIAGLVSSACSPFNLISSFSWRTTILTEFHCVLYKIFTAVAFVLKQQRRIILLIDFVWMYLYLYFVLYLFCCINSYMWSVYLWSLAWDFHWGFLGFDFTEIPPRPILLLLSFLTFLPCFYEFFWYYIFTWLNNHLRSILGHKLFELCFSCP